MSKRSPFAFAVALFLATLGSASGVRAQTTPGDERVQRILTAYPDALDRIEGNTLVWRDGTRMELDDGKGQKAFSVWLADPDIEDTLEVHYPAGSPATAPAKDSDPGRARNLAFFNKMYGDCRTGEVEKHLVDVIWLTKKAPQHLRVTRVNGVDKALAAISAELDALPPELNSYLIPAAGTYNCRLIEGTSRPSAHGQGIAIDIALKRSDYWRWSKTGANGALAYRNSIPEEIVRIFEKHGFIWGGRWYHFDTMHFEYRPELLP